MTHDSTRDLKSLQELPLLPHTFDRIMRLLDDPRSSEHKLAEAVAQDPALTLKVLRLANSPYYGASGQVTGLDQALGLIGSTSTRGLLLSLHLLQSHLESVRPQLERLAHHAYAAAQAARVIARMQRRPQVSLIVSAALLHDLGYLCRLQAFPDVTEAANWEQRLAQQVTDSGVSHHEWGYACALAWNLPEEIGQTIRHYRRPPAESPHYWLLAVIHAGDVICREQGLSPLGRVGAMDPGVASFLGLNPEQLAQIETETRLVLQQTGWLPGTSSLLEHLKK